MDEGPRDDAGPAMVLIMADSTALGTGIRIRTATHTTVLVSSSSSSIFIDKFLRIQSKYLIITNNTYSVYNRIKLSTYSETENKLIRFHRLVFSVYQVLGTEL